MSTAPRTAHAKRDWGSDDRGCDFLHVDMDSFFASVELLEHPELRGRPVIVGGLTPRSVVCAATYEARAYGVRAAQPVSLALRKCPQAVVLPTRHGLYSQVSQKVMAILREITDRVEQVSVDEAFLDVRGAHLRLGSSTQIGHLIRRRIATELGLPASVGIGAVKFISKIASAHAKPDGLLLVPRARTQDFLDVLQIDAMWGVGPKSAMRLHSLGVRTVAQLRRLDKKVLRSVLGESAADHLWQLSRGIDERKVQPQRERKSLGKEQTFSGDIADRELLHAVLLAQAQELGARLRSAGLLSSSVGIKVRYSDFSTVSRTKTMPHPTASSREICAASDELLQKVSLSKPVRLLGTRLENLSPAEQGMQVQIAEQGRGIALEKVGDLVRERFGSDSLRVATLLQMPAADDTESSVRKLDE